jgi:hypothetical protein
MTRTEYTVLKDAVSSLKAGDLLECMDSLARLCMAAEIEFEAEDAHHDAAEKEAGQ